MKPIQGIFFRDFENAYIPEILKELYRDRIYDLYLKGKKDLMMLDIGANIGLFSFYAYPYAKKIFSIEPSEAHMQCLVTMVMSNNMEDRINPVRVAISNKNGKEEFFHNQNTTMYSLRQEVNSLPEEKEEVETMTLDTLFARNAIKHVDFMKIDVEGSEYEIFASDGFAKVAPKIDIIMGEYHTWPGVNPHQFAACIRDQGFTFDWLNKTEASVFVAKRI